MSSTSHIIESLVPDIQLDFLHISTDAMFTDYTQPQTKKGWPNPPCDEKHTYKQ